MTSDDAHFRLRLPAELHAQLIEIASKNRRSINSEIIARLQGSLAWDKYDPDSLAADVARLEEEMSRVMEVLRERGFMR